MKKIHLLLLTLTVCFFTACHKDIWAELESLDQRVTKLEELCKEMNTNITSLQTIVDVLQSNDFITGIVEIKKNGEVIGYTITFGKHDPITIYHGQDGKDGADGKDGQDGSANAPVIGVAQDTDGVYYWTLNGEWLLDDNGNKLPVSGKDGQNGTNGSNGQDGADGKDGQDGEDGQDGKDGITPQLKIEDGYWYISYDNGATWTQLGKATGEDGKDGANGEDGKDGQNGADGKDGQDGADGKDGQDGDSMFQSVTQDENYVYFTLADGTVIKIAKGNSNDTQPNENEIIVFNDLEVKRKLILFGVDTTLDGEISYGEATAYTNELGFRDNTTIYSFKEFSYFTALKTIENYAFHGCTKLFEIVFPNNITSIGDYAFEECYSLISLTIPNNVTKIGDYAFYNCSALTSINIPNSVEEIGEDAFYKCSKLKSFTFPENFKNLQLHIYDPSNISTIYWNTINLDEFSCSDNNYTYRGLAYCRYYYDTHASNKTIKKVIIGDNVQIIPNYLCLGLEGLAEIIIPNNVTKIGSEAFRGCNSLISVTIGNSVATIGSSAFYKCSSLTTIIIPENVTSIGTSAFADCSKLQYCYSKATTPPILGTNGLPTTIGIIYVPRASVDEYRALWSDYADKIVGYDFE